MIDEDFVEDFESTRDFTCAAVGKMRTSVLSQANGTRTAGFVDDVAIVTTV